METDPDPFEAVNRRILSWVRELQLAGSQITRKDFMSQYRSVLEAEIVRLSTKQEPLGETEHSWLQRVHERLRVLDLPKCQSRLLRQLSSLYEEEQPQASRPAWPQELQEVSPPRPQPASGGNQPPPPPNKRRRLASKPADESSTFSEVTTRRAKMQTTRWTATCAPARAACLSSQPRRGPSSRNETGRRRVSEQ